MDEKEVPVSSKKRVIGGMRCVAYGRWNTHRSVPDPEKDPERYTAWVRAVKRTRAEWEPPSKSSSASAFLTCVLCSEHFEDCFDPANQLMRSFGLAPRSKLLPNALSSKWGGAVLTIYADSFCGDLLYSCKVLHQASVEILKRARDKVTE